MRKRPKYVLTLWSIGRALRDIPIHEGAGEWVTVRDVKYGWRRIWRDCAVSLLLLRLPGVKDLGHEIAVSRGLLRYVAAGNWGSFKETTPRTGEMRGANGNTPTKTSPP